MTGMAWDSFSPNIQPPTAGHRFGDSLSSSFEISFFQIVYLGDIPYTFYTRDPNPKLTGRAAVILAPGPNPRCTAA